MGRTTTLNRPGAMLNAPPPPDDLSAEGKLLWKQTLGARPSAEWNRCDTTLLGLYVGAALDVRRLDREIAAQGEVVSGRINPLVHVRASRETLLLSVAKKLRLTPCSRYTARRVGELHRHASKAASAATALDDDDLLARPGRLQ
jgi:phage terminase small subunit